jgi:hydroxypyruvate isomerase
MKNTQNRKTDDNSNITRRSMLQGAAGLAAVGVAAMATQTFSKGKAKDKPEIQGVKKGRIKQSIATWCFMDAGEKWKLDKLCQVVKQLNVPGLDVVPIKDFPVLKKHGIDCACSMAHLFVRGMNNKMHWKECHGKLEESINACAEAGYKNTITFTGFLDTTPEGLKKVGMKITGKEQGSRVSPEEGIKNCVEGYKKIVGLAEKKKIVINLEMLNTRDTTHPMKGHPGYQGNHVDICMDIIKKVGSSNLKLLFDVYHVQIMDGDVIRRIRELKDYIGLVHLAGNPGRGELDEKQEINYKAVMQALADVGYQGYATHEWVPTRDPLQGLSEAVTLCDV